MSEPVSYRDFIRVLRDLGFEQKPRTATSHEKWHHLDFKGVRRVVTVSGHNEPYARSVLRSMIKQIGISKKDFHACLEIKGFCESLR